MYVVPTYTTSTHLYIISSPIFPKIHVNSYSRYLNGRIRALRLQGDPYENDAPHLLLYTVYVAQFSDCNNRNNDSISQMINEINLAQNAQHAQYTILLYFFPRRQYEKVRIGILLIFSLAHLLLQEVASLYELEQTRQGIYKKKSNIVCNTCNYSLDGGRLV